MNGKCAKRIRFATERLMTSTNMVVDDRKQFRLQYKRLKRNYMKVRYMYRKLPDGVTVLSHSQTLQLKGLK